MMASRAVRGSMRLRPRRLGGSSSLRSGSIISQRVSGRCQSVERTVGGVFVEPFVRLMLEASVSDRRPGFAVTLQGFISFSNLLLTQALLQFALEFVGVLIETIFNHLSPPETQELHRFIPVHIP